MRPIDADKLKEVLEKNFGHTGGASVLAQLIDAQLTIDPEPHWIPVTEKLPGIGEPVLDESLSVNWMSYKSGGKEWVFPRDVKAWIPLPGEPYKGVTT